MNDAQLIEHAVKEYSEEFREFAEVIGAENAVAFAEKKGGRHTSVMRWHDDLDRLGQDVKEMIAMFGVEITKKACIHFDGCQIKLPECKRIKTKMKALQIIAALETEGMTSEQASLAFGLSTRSIRDVKQKGKGYYFPTAYGTGEKDG